MILDVVCLYSLGDKPVGLTCLGGILWKYVAVESKRRGKRTTVDSIAKKEYFLTLFWLLSKQRPPQNVIDFEFKFAL